MGIICKRRKILSTNSPHSHFDPITNTCTIESYLAAKDPFRVSPRSHIPPPLPHDSAPCSEAARIIEADLHNSIVEAAPSFEITDASISALKVWERGLPGTARDTLIISTTSTDTTRWREAVECIYGMDEAAAVPAGVEMGVELRNPHKMYDDISAPRPQGLPSSRYGGADHRS